MAEAAQKPSPIEADRQSRYMESISRAQTAQRVDIPTQQNTAPNQAAADDPFAYNPANENDLFDQTPGDTEEPIEESEEDTGEEEGYVPDLPGQETAGYVSAAVQDQVSAAAQFAESQARALAQQAVDRATDAAKDAVKKVGKKAAKNILIRLGILSVDSLAVTSDGSTFGISTIWDTFIAYFPTLVWFNVEMIYGYYMSGYFITGKESFIGISPLTIKSFNIGELFKGTKGEAYAEWAEKLAPDILVHGFVVCLDVLFIALISVVLGLVVLILYMLVLASENVYSAAYTLLNGEFGLLGDFVQYFGL